MAPNGTHVFTSESVTEGHPDKIADQISDAVLDAILDRDPDPRHARVACETLFKTGMAVIAGEITTTAKPDYERIIRDTIKLTAVRARTEQKAVVLRVTTFNDQTFPNLRDGLEEMIEEVGGLDNLNGVVIDLRNNAGGLLSEAIRVSDAFLDQGEIVSTRGRDPEDGERYNATPGDLIEGLPLVVLAGFMRLLSDGFVAHYLGRMLNIHPSLLPAYTGLNTHRRVLEAGDTQHGASVHFVTAELDGGPLILQARVDVQPNETPDSLAAPARLAIRRSSTANSSPSSMKAFRLR